MMVQAVSELVNTAMAMAGPTCHRTPLETPLATAVAVGVAVNLHMALVWIKNQVHLQFPI